MGIGSSKFAFLDKLLLVFTIFTCTFFVYRDFGIRMLYGYVFLGSWMLLYIIRIFIQKKKQRFNLMNIMLILMAGVIFLSFLRPDARHDRDTMSYMIAMFMCILYMLMTEKSIKEQEIFRSVKIIYGTALAFSFYVLFFVFFENIFWVTIYPLLSETAAAYLAYYIPRGYSVSIGGVTFTNYILLMGIACSIGRFMTEPADIKRRYRYILAVIYFASIILLTGRRGEFLGVILTCAVLFIMDGKNLKRCLLRAALLCGGIMVCIGIAILALPLLKKINVLYRYAFTLEKLLQGNDITSGRIQLYQWAWELFCEKPIFGAGWGRFADCISDAFHAIHGMGVSDVHCIYLQFLCETGIIGTILILLPMFGIYFTTARHWWRLRTVECKGTKEKVIVLANAIGFIIQTFVLIMGIYDPCFERVVFWCFYGIAVIMSSGALMLENKDMKEKACNGIKSNG